MIRIFSSILFGCVVLASADVLGYQFNEHVKGLFKFHRIPATFKDAFLRCKFEGAVLASPLDVNFTKAMVEMHEKSGSECGIFTGIHATISKGDFTSIDGIPLDKIPVTWAPGEPDNLDNQEDCIVMLQNGSVADAKCSETNPYVCYKKETLNQKGTVCGTDPGYKYDQRTDSCYKFYNVGKTWRHAQMTCLAEGGHLAIINSDVETLVLKELFAEHPSSTIVGAFRDNIALGFLDWDKKGSWYTVNGETLEEAGTTTKWADGNPNINTEHDGGQFCGSLFRWAQLDNIWCDSIPIPFICEKSPAMFH